MTITRHKCSLVVGDGKSSATSAPFFVEIDLS
jgi:hypothetical protein